jgi:beta-phosphoglucomutase-like phosphatase (HAD superfamily)
LTAHIVSARPAAFLFDLDGTLVDSVYEHVLAWREALEQVGIELAVWRIHRRIGMSGGLLINALLRETGTEITAKLVEESPAPTRRGLCPPVGAGSAVARRQGSAEVSD